MLIPYVLYLVFAIIPRLKYICSETLITRSKVLFDEITSGLVKETRKP